MSTGTLYVVATPIGNLDDISPRARSVLAEVAVIAAEDTRHTGRLLQRLGISTPMLSCHEHNEGERTPELLEQLATGKDVALVSDAGTPLLSDPGFQLVREAAAQGIPVSPVPGCSAALAALSVAGLPTDSFRFIGFLPTSAGKRRAQLKDLAAQPDTLICYESVHRIGALLEDIVGLFGADRPVVAGRELTKLHETIYRGTASEVVGLIAADPGGGKGEYTLVIGGAPLIAPQATDIDRVLSVMLRYLGVRQAAEATAKLLDIGKNQAYERALELREESDGEY